MKRLPRPALTLALLFLGASPLLAGDFEISGFIGLSAPTYSQTFSYQPPPPPTVSGIRIDQRGDFELQATGGTAFGGAVVFFPIPAVGIEARLDTADMDLETRNASYSVGVTLPQPIGNVSTQLDLPNAEVDLERPRPVSLNVRVRVPGTVSVGLSGGVSYLPSLKVRVVQPLAVTSSVLDLVGGRVDVGEVPVVATADPTVEGSRIGGNLGLGLAFEVGETVAIAVEARGFYFKEHRLTWSRADNQPLNAVEEIVVDEALRALPVVEFEPIFFNVTAGLTLRF
jgi:hypothetical protein